MSPRLNLPELYSTYVYHHLCPPFPPTLHLHGSRWIPKPAVLVGKDYSRSMTGSSKGSTITAPQASSPKRSSATQFCKVRRFHGIRPMTRMPTAFGHSLCQQQSLRRLVEVLAAAGKETSTRKTARGRAPVAVTSGLRIVAVVLVKPWTGPCT